MFSSEHSVHPDVAGKNEESNKDKCTIPSPPASSGHRSSSVVLSDGAQAQGAQRGKEQQGRGRGSGSCGSHFIKQPENRQRCFSGSDAVNHNLTEQNHAIRWNKKLITTGIKFEVT